MDRQLRSLPFRPSEAETVGEISPQSSPEFRALRVINNGELIVEPFEHIVVFLNLLIICPL